jgi:GTP-binding protein
MLYAYDLVRHELESYSEELLAKPTLLCMNKCDLLDPEEIAKVCAAFRERGLDIIPISANTGEGIDDLRRHLEESVAELDEPTADTRSTPTP